MKIAITGASGHIGGVLCRDLLTEGHEVVALVRSSTKALKDLKLTKVDGDVLHLDSLRLLMQGCDAVIHAAGAIKLGYKFNKKLHDINVVGTKNVLQIAKELNIPKVIHFSSIHVFKQRPYEEELNETRGFVDEKSVFYDQTKRDGHLLALEAAKNGQHVVVVCPTGVVGPIDFAPSKLGKAVIDIYNGKIPAVVKGGFDFVDVRDVVQGALLALEKGRSGETYILGGHYYSIKAFADMVLHVKNSKKKMAVLPFFMAILGVPFIKLWAFLTKEPPLYDRVYMDILQDGNKKVSSNKAKNELGYQPRPLTETIADTINWFKESGKIKTK